MAKKLTPAVLVTLALLLLPACGDKTDEATRAAGITPADALALVTVNLEPSIEQKRNLLSVARRFPAASEKAKGEFDETRDELLGDLVEAVGLDFKRDVEPWLGGEVAFALLPPAGGHEPRPVVFVQTTDKVKATAALEKVRKSGDFEGRYRMVEGFAVISDQSDPAGDDKVLDVIEAQAGKDDGGLASSKSFNDVVDELAGDRLVLAWTDVQAVIRLAEQSSPLPGFDLTKAFKDASSVAVDLHAEKEALVFEGVSRPFNSGKGGTAEITEGLSQDSIGAFTFFDVSTVFKQVTEIVTGGGGGEGAGVAEEFRKQTGLDLQADILSWMEGEFVVVAGAVPEGGTFPDFGLVIEPTDPEKAKAAVPKIVSALQRTGDIQLQERKVGDGTTAYVFPAAVTPGVQPAMALFGDRFVLANRIEYLEQLSKPASSTLGDSSSYRKVVGEGSSRTVAQMVLRIDPIREAIEKAFLGYAEGDERGDYENEVRPNLEPLDAFGFLARHDGGFDRFEMRVTFD
ncbi:MAG TPA: DUF3352 domain-containing protein [Acidimicrobiales bacterium]|nr:DUF3352 domain-containing protein [Acidimicrobiales bacterium]